MVPGKFDRSENPDWEPDALVEVIFTGIDGSIRNGFRPHYKVAKDYLTTACHWFIDSGEALPNLPTMAFVKFITPEAYPGCLESGLLIEVSAGSRKIGSARIIKIYNELLRRSS